MNDIATFHALITELLDSIGFELGNPEPTQDLFTLLVDDCYTLHLGLIDAANAYVRVELPDAAHVDSPYTEWLQHNAFNGLLLQPVIALDPFRRPMCYLRFALDSSDTAPLISAFHAMLRLADTLSWHITVPGTRQ